MAVLVMPLDGSLPVCVWRNGAGHARPGRGSEPHRAITLAGLEDQIWGVSHYPKGATNPPGSPWSTAEVRHYFDNGTYNTQCADADWGNAYCEGTSWGTAPCQKRYVGGADGYMSRHWVRWQAPPCGGQMHG